MGREWSWPPRTCPGPPGRADRPDRRPVRAAARPVRQRRSHPTPAQVDQHEAELARHGKDYEFHRYASAGHAFFYYQAPIYRPEQAMDGWEKMFGFFGRKLSSFSQSRQAAAVAASCRSRALVAPLRQLSATEADRGSGKMSSSSRSTPSRMAPATEAAETFGMS